MSSEVKRYWPEEIVGTGELVVYAEDYAALEAECKILRNSLAGSNNQARANKLEAEKFAIDWLRVLEERDALAAELAGEGADQLAGGLAGLDGFGRAIRDDGDLAVEERAELHDGAGADLMQNLAAEGAQGVLILGGDDGGHPLETVLGDGFGGEFLGEAGGLLGLVTLQLLLELLLMGEQ